MINIQLPFAGTLVLKPNDENSACAKGSCTKPASRDDDSAAPEAPAFDKALNNACSKVNKPKENASDKNKETKENKDAKEASVCEDDPESEAVAQALTVTAFMETVPVIPPGMPGVGLAEMPTTTDITGVGNAICAIEAETSDLPGLGIKPIGLSSKEFNQPGIPGLLTAQVSTEAVASSELLPSDPQAAPVMDHDAALPSQALPEKTESAQALVATVPITAQSSAVSDLPVPQDGAEVAPLVQNAIDALQKTLPQQASPVAELATALRIQRPNHGENTPGAQVRAQGKGRPDFSTSLNAVLTHGQAEQVKAAAMAAQSGQTTLGEVAQTPLGQALSELLKEAKVEEAPLKGNFVEAIQPSDASALGSPIPSLTGPDNGAPVSKLDGILHLKGTAGPMLNQIAEGTEIGIRSGRGEVALQLNPNSLGNVRIHIAQGAAGAIHARFIAENAEAHAALQEQLGSLRETLENQGIKVERLSVIVAGHRVVDSTNSLASANSGGFYQPSGDEQASHFNQPSHQDAASQHFQHSQQQETHRHFATESHRGRGIGLQNNPGWAQDGVNEDPAASRPRHEGWVDLHV